MQMEWKRRKNDDFRPMEFVDPNSGPRMNIFDLIDTKRVTDEPSLSEVSDLIGKGSNPQSRFVCMFVCMCVLVDLEGTVIIASQNEDCQRGEERKV